MGMADGRRPHMLLRSLARTHAHSGSRGNGVHFRKKVPLPVHCARAFINILACCAAVSLRNAHWLIGAARPPSARPSVFAFLLVFYYIIRPGSSSRNFNRPRNLTQIRSPVRSKVANYPPGRIHFNHSLGNKPTTEEAKLAPNFCRRRVQLCTLHLRTVYTQIKILWCICSQGTNVRPDG